MQVQGKRHGHRPAHPPDQADHIVRPGLARGVGQVDLRGAGRDQLPCRGHHLAPRYRFAVAAKGALQPGPDHHALFPGPTHQPGHP